MTEKSSKEKLDALFPLFKEERFKNIREDAIPKITADFYAMRGYKPDLYFDLAIKKFVIDYFGIKRNKIIVKADSFVKTYLIPTKNPDHYYFIHIDGSRLKVATKVNLYKLRYMINGQILKGQLKGSKKDNEILTDFKKQFTNKNIRALVPSEVFKRVS